jgi:hypothetical protein
VSCWCHFSDECGDLPRHGVNDEHWVDEVLNRRFLRLGTGGFCLEPIWVLCAGILNLLRFFVSKKNLLRLLVVRFIHLCSVVAGKKKQWRSDRSLSSPRVTRSVGVSEILLKHELYNI